jgi:hypothetical protein
MEFVTNCINIFLYKYWFAINSLEHFVTKPGFVKITQLGRFMLFCNTFVLILGNFRDYNAVHEAVST